MIELQDVEFERLKPWEELIEDVGSLVVTVQANLTPSRRLPG